MHQSSYNQAEITEFINTLQRHSFFTDRSLPVTQRLVTLFTADEFNRAIEARLKFNPPSVTPDLEAAQPSSTDPFDLVLINMYKKLNEIDNIDFAEISAAIDNRMLCSSGTTKFRNLKAKFTEMNVSINSQQFCVVMTALQLFYNKVFIEAFPAINYHKNRDPDFFMMKQAVGPNLGFEILGHYPQVVAFLEKHLPPWLQVILPIINVIVGYLVANLIQLCKGGVYGERTSRWGSLLGRHSTPPSEQTPLINATDELDPALLSSSLLQQHPNKYWLLPKTPEQEQDLLWQTKLRGVTVTNTVLGVVKTVLLKYYDPTIAVWWPPLLPIVIACAIGYGGGLLYHKYYTRPKFFPSPLEGITIQS